MFGTWDLVRPRFWHPLASMEQSMMDFDRMTDRMFTSFDRDMRMMSMSMLHDDDDDFFRDLPVQRHHQHQHQHQQHQQHQHRQHQQDIPQQTQSQHQQQHMGTTQTQTATPEQEQSSQQPQQTTPTSNNNHKDQAFSSYSYSSSTILNDKGQQVMSTRRRYEDSTGRLKAVHERQIGNKKVRTLWNRQDKNDEGKHETLCAECNADEFEKEWKNTAFGAALEQKKAEAIKEKGEEQKQEHAKI